jgi:hypothetical protein
MRKFGLAYLTYICPDELPPSELQTVMQPFTKKKPVQAQIYFHCSATTYPTKWCYRPEPVSIKSEASRCFQFASDQSECQNWIRVNRRF